MKRFGILAAVLALLVMMVPVGFGRVVAPMNVVLAQDADGLTPADPETWSDEQPAGDMAISEDSSSDTGVSSQSVSEAVVRTSPAYPYFHYGVNGQNLIGTGSAIYKCGGAKSCSDFRVIVRLCNETTDGSKIKVCGNETKVRGDQTIDNTWVTLNTSDDGQCTHISQDTKYYTKLIVQRKNNQGVWDTKYTDPGNRVSTPWICPIS